MVIPGLFLGYDANHSCSRLSSVLSQKMCGACLGVVVFVWLVLLGGVLLVGSDECGFLVLHLGSDFVCACFEIVAPTSLHPALYNVKLGNQAISLKQDGEKSCL